MALKILSYSKKCSAVVNGYFGGCVNLQVFGTYVIVKRFPMWRISINFI